LAARGRKSNELANRDLAPRVRPIQDRAKHTVDLILDTASTLLEEIGIDAFNTNLLAERAQVAVRSVYRYYPNKLAVIVGLAERQADEWQAKLDELIVGMQDPEQSALDVWDQVLDAYVEYLEAGKGWSAIRRAMQSMPQLRQVNGSENDALSRAISLNLQACGATQPLPHLRLVGRLLLETSDAAIDDALSRSGSVPSATLDELKLMHRSYLAIYVD
jgi:AcrR family transcriptional regulator